MPTLNLTQTDFLSALQALLPTGRAWPKDKEAIQTQVLSGLAASYAHQTARSNHLIIDAFPASSYECLPEWEAALGLPDPCAGEYPTVQQRRSQVVARLTNAGGQSAQYFIDFAKLLGYAITITQYAPFRCGQSHCTDALGSAEWFFTWSINAPINTLIHFAAGQSVAGEPLAHWGNKVLECELRTIQPAHTFLQFHYWEDSDVSN